MWHRVGTTRLGHAARVALAVVTSDLMFSPINRCVGLYCNRVTGCPGDWVTG